MVRIWVRKNGKKTKAWVRKNGKKSQNKTKRMMNDKKKTNKDKAYA